MQKRRQGEKSGLAASLIFHGIIVAIVFLWAAKTGKLDFVPKVFDVVLERKKEEPPKKTEPKVEPAPKPETPPPVATPRTPNLAPIQSANVAPPPAVSLGGPSAPPAATLPAMFSTEEAIAADDPVLQYKAFMEYAFYSNWVRPADIADAAYVAEVEITIGPSGEVIRQDWKKSSGDKKWDDSIRAALNKTKQLRRAPPKQFPGTIVLRFDVTSG